MTARISDAYRLVRHLAAESPGCPLDLRELETEVAGADGVLASDERMSDESAAETAEALSGCGESVEHALSTLGVFAMNLSTVFNNLANDIATLIVHRRNSGQFQPDKG